MNSPRFSRFLAALILAGSSAASTHATLVFEDQFAIPPNDPGTLPVGWTSAGEGTENDEVDTENLTFPGLAAGEEGSWIWDGSGDQKYFRDFSTTPLEAGEMIYYSFLFRMDDPGTLTSGFQSFVGLATKTVTAMGNGVTASFGIRRDAIDPMKYNVSVSGSFRGPHSELSQIVGGGQGGSEGGTQFSVGETYLLVAAYTNAAHSVAEFWINPDSASFGGAEPSSTITDEAPARDIQRLLTQNPMGTTDQSEIYTIDAFRIGTTWADVTPPAAGN